MFYWLQIILTKPSLIFTTLDIFMKFLECSFTSISNILRKKYIYSYLSDFLGDSFESYQLLP